MDGLIQCTKADFSGFESEFNKNFFCLKLSSTFLKHSIITLDSSNLILKKYKIESFVGSKGILLNSLK